MLLGPPWVLGARHQAIMPLRPGLEVIKECLDESASFPLYLLEYGFLMHLFGIFVMP
jgi:hypothetical protein